VKLLVLGTGLMGPAAAYDAMAAAEVTGVGLADASQPQLDQALARLAGRPGADKLAPAVVDVRDAAAAARLLGEYDVVVSALPAPACAPGIRAALAAGVPMVTLTWPPPEALADLRREADARSTLVMLGCGVEPGLTEILARHLAERLDRVDELHILCGGIPETPDGPLGYKIVFGGRQLPLRETDVPVVEDGQVRTAPRYSAVERVAFPGLGELEAWHEGFRTTLLQLPAFRGLRVGTQKTVRWPGYAAKASVLRDLGLLSLEPVVVDGAPVVPKRLVDAVLYPRVRLGEEEGDVTVLRVTAVGTRGGEPARGVAELVDRADRATGFTSMARTTGFTAAIVARLIGRRALGGRGIQPPEHLVAGLSFDRLMTGLALHGVRFTIE
jgi:saccharopine dehydrogenase-like NADP-dependent oxidoreductase